MSKIQPLIDQILNDCKKPGETVEVQFTLKGYDFKKDVRFDSNCLLPYPKKKNSKVLIIANEDLALKAAELGLKYVKYEDVQGNTRDKKLLKNKLGIRHDAFIVPPDFNKAFEMRVFARKRKPHFIIKNPAELFKLYEEVLRTVKFKLRKTNTVAFTAGYNGMETEKIIENIITGIQHFVGLLKKGIGNVGSIHFKTTQGKSVRLY
ncbi:60S ribosomal protein L1 [Astathelohania contejeani]|uniref:60S ribosomal protein L1 n=1 Tax=Astathelohania contejeani TaxID=164912 RepID=A0ABQ7HXR1_9MICR|nr:60S ribosomal protein L1 [Thelohania contejeani]